MKIFSLLIAFCIHTLSYGFTDLVATKEIDPNKLYAHSTGLFFQNNDGSPDELGAKLCEEHQMKFISQETRRETSHMQGVFEVSCGVKSTYCSIKPLLTLSQQSKSVDPDWVREFGAQLNENKSLAAGAAAGVSLIVHGIDLLTTVRYSFQELICDEMPSEAGIELN